RRGSRESHILWTALLLVWLTPALLLAYTWGQLVPLTPGLSLELLYAGVLIARLLPLAAMLSVLLPAPVLGPTSLHCHDLLGRRWRPLALYWYGGVGRWAGVAAIVFVVAFAEFEIASLLGVRTWTVWLFDAQVGGLALTETLWAARWPCGIQLAA